MRPRQFTSLFLALPLAAQQTWNVSPPGANLTAAVAAAQHGDTIVLAAGFYNVGAGITTSRGIAMIGAPGATIYGAGRGPVLTVTQLPTGRSFVMQGIAVDMGGFHDYAILVTSNQGAVHFSRCQFSNSSTDFSVADEFWVQGCQNVSLTDCTTQRLTFYAIESNVQLARCSLVGLRARVVSVTYGRSAGLALWVQGARVTLAQCSATGGDGEGQFPGAAAISSFMATASLTITGDASDAIRAGAASGALASPAIENLGPPLTIASAIRLVPNPGQPAISGPFTNAPRPIATAAQTGPRGGSVAVTVIADVGEILWLFLGEPSAPWPIPGLGHVWVRPDRVATIGSGVAGFGGLWTATIPIPALPFLRAVPFTVQALSAGVVGPARFSAPCTFVIE